MIEISEKNKKSEILEAYHAALRELKEKKSEKPAEEKKRKEEKSLMEEADKLSCEGVIKGIAHLKFEITKSLDEIERSFHSKFNEHQDYIKAIRIAEKNLSELHSISQEAETLQALITSQKEAKISYELEMRELQSEWEKKKRDFEEEFELEKERRLRERKREEEEYLYNMKLSRQKDKDDYEQYKAVMQHELETRRAQVERELSEREKMISAHENEYQYLKEKVEAFPEEMQTALDAAHKQTEEMVKRDLQFEMQLKEKEIASERRLFQQEKEALFSRIQEQEQRIAELSQKSHEASLQMKEIAFKAVEGASFRNRFDSAHLKGIMQEN